jgi:hypothetical protein
MSNQTALAMIYTCPMHPQIERDRCCKKAELR